MRVTQKGQVTIPLDVRRALGIETGSDVQFEFDSAGRGSSSSRDSRWARDRGACAAPAMSR